MVIVQFHTILKSIKASPYLRRSGGGGVGHGGCRGRSGAEAAEAAYGGAGGQPRMMGRRGRRRRRLIMVMVGVVVEQVRLAVHVGRGEGASPACNLHC